MAALSNIEIQKYHKHRYPFLLVDTIDDIIPGKSAVGKKQFSSNEWLFHCNIQKNQPVPFTMLVEILTEVFLLPILVLDNNRGKITNFLQADNVVVKKNVFPGDCLIVKAETNSWRRGIAKGKATGYIGNEVVCYAELKFAIPDELNKYKPD